MSERLAATKSPRTGGEREVGVVVKEQQKDPPHKENSLYLTV